VSRRLCSVVTWFSVFAFRGTCEGYFIRQNYWWISIISILYWIMSLKLLLKHWLSYISKIFQNEASHIENILLQGTRIVSKSVANNVKISSISSKRWSSFNVLYFRKGINENVTLKKFNRRFISFGFTLSTERRSEWRNKIWL
jgi:hypothetical protein